jgi:formylglycine-generating enzyme required for sulfatase activity
MRSRTCGVQRGGEYSQCVTKTGVYDLLGNVDEWLYDCNAAPADSSSPRGCLTMGGGYDAPVESCRLEHTLRNDTRLPSLGFRCCAALTGPEERERELGVAKD